MNNDSKVASQILQKIMIFLNILVLLGFLLGGVKWYYLTQTNGKDIRNLQQVKLDKEIYEMNLKAHKEKDEKLENAINKLTDAVNDLRVQLARQQ